MKKRTAGLGVRLLLLSWMISMLVTTIMGVLFYRRFSTSVKESYRNTVEENLRTRADRFDAMMKEAYLTAVYIVSDEKLVKLVEGTRRKDSCEELIELLRQYCRENDTIHSIYCYLRSSDQLVQASAEDGQVQEGSFINHAWINRAAQGELMDPFSPVYNLDSTSVIRRNFFTYGKQILDAQGKDLGNIFINVDERQVYFSCLQTEGSSLGTLSVVWEERIASADRVSRIRKKLEPETAQTILVETDTAENGYRLCSLSDSSVLEQDLLRSRNWILLVALLLNLLLAAPVYLVLREMLYPMKQLEESMNRVKDGDLSVRVRIYSGDEIGRLSANFNDMLQQIETLIDELVTQKMLKKEAELEALSYQITPHFMYNTLSSIRYAAILEGYEEIGDLLQAFIELLRLSASDRGAFITVRQECRMVSNYIRLQQFRYKDSFEAEVDMDPDTEDCCVPRLLIQPLVENAILHGLNHAEEGNLIRVTVKRREKELEIRVADNGSGMSRKEIAALLSGGFHSKFSGIGINNIIERLKLYYGDRGRLEYVCPEEGGTTAVITLPVSEDAEEFVI